MTRVVVVGGGVIGLASAWELARAGHEVAVVADPERRPATWAAAGMLAPITEAWFGEEELLRLGLDSARRWPAFAHALTEATGRDIGFSTAGTVITAATDDDRRELERLVAYHHELGLRAERLSRRELRARVPTLAPSTRAGAWAPDDHSVDNRALLGALAAAAPPVVAGRAVHVDADAVGLADGTRIEGDVVVVAAGWASGALVDVAVRPVKGQILRLRGPHLLDHTIRAIVDGARVYLVPRTNGEVVVGATMEEMGDDTTVTAGAVYELLRDAIAVVPGLKEHALVESTAGLRPGSPTNAPTVEVRDGVVVAAGHFRNGILLAPWTAARVVELVGARIGAAA